MSFEKMVSSLELTEDDINSKGHKHRKFSSSASSFYVGQQTNNRRMICFSCEHPGHLKRDCFYNPKSKKYERKLKPSANIIGNLKKQIVGI